MKNEEFDEAIREKLDSFNQAFTESDIDKVFDHAVKKRIFPLKGSTGSWLLYSLSAAAITVLTVWMVTQFNAHEPLTVVNDTTSLKNSQITVDTTLLINNPNEAEKIEPSVKITEEQISAKDEANKQVVESDSENNNQEKTTLKPSVILEEKPSKTTLNPVSEKVNVPQPTEAPAITGKNDLAIVTVPVENRDTVQNNQIHDSKQGVQPAITTQESVKTEPVQAEIPALPFKDENTKKEDETPVSKESGIPPKPENPVKIKTNLFNESTTRVGADFQLSNQAFGTSVTGEFILKNHFGFKTGLRYSMYKTEHFMDKEDMFRQKHHGFNHSIENHFSDKEHVTDVAINNRLLQVPVAFTYYVPLKRNFNISFSLGTDIDIYCNQKLSYTDKSDSTGHHNDNFTTKGEVSPINNLVISAGLEKQWKSWIIQVQPFIAPKIKEVFYKPKELEFGVGIGVKYRFGQ